MDEAEGKKRIAIWETKKQGYIRKGNKSGITRADATIARIKAAMDTNIKSDNEYVGSIVESESKKSYKLGKSVKEDKGGLI